MLRSWILVLITCSGAAAQTTAPVPSPGFPNCYICGNSSYTIANPNANVTFPGQYPVPCFSLFNGGLTGFVDPTYCPVIQGFKGIKACGCKIGAVAPTAPAVPVAPIAPTAAAPAVPVAPIAPAPTPAPAPTSYPACNICGEKAWRVWAPDTVLTLPGDEGQITCGDLEVQALNGTVDPDSCQGLIAIGTPAECNCKLCRDPTYTPIPVDPLGQNRTCRWLVSNYNKPIAKTAGLILDPSLFGDTTWGSYLCTDLGQSYTAHDICVATCGNQCNPNCNDDNTKTFNAGKFGQQTCAWLAQSPRNWDKFCSGVAGQLCPYTCNLCP